VLVHVDVTTHQARSPKRLDLHRVPEEADVPARGCPPHEDDLTAWGLLQIQGPGFGERTAWRRGREACRGAPPDRGHMAFGAFSQGCQRLVMKPGPDCPLPPTIPVFHTGLQPRLLHRGKHRHDVQAETAPHHTADTVTVLVRPLKRRVVVELGIGREPPSAPVCRPLLAHVARGHRWARPSRIQAAVQRNSGQDFTVGAAANHPAFDDVEAVKFRSVQCTRSSRPSPARLTPR